MTFPSLSGSPRILLALLVLVPGAVAGQDAGGGGSPSVGGEVRTSVLSFDNLVSRNGEPVNALALRLGGRIDWSWDRALDGVRLYLDGEATDYESFGTSPDLRIGVEWRAGRHRFQSTLRREWERPAFYVNDRLDHERSLRLENDWSWRFHDDWEMGASLGGYEERYDLLADKESETWQAAASMRYRGWGYTFSPELGVRYRHLDARSDHYDYTQRDVTLKLRSVPARGVYLVFRYRYRIRDYQTSESRDSNFLRRDNRHQFRMEAFWRENELVEWGLYAARENVDSARPGSSFRTTILGVGVRWHL